MPIRHRKITQLILKPRQSRKYPVKIDPATEPQAVGIVEPNPADAEPGPGSNQVETEPLTESASVPPEEPEKPRSGLSTFDSLSVPVFRWYLGSMLGWFASMNMQMLARGWLTFELTGSFASLGLVSLANAVPGMILSLPGGVLADRVNKKRIIQFGQLANTLLSGLIAALIFSGSLTFEWLLVSALLQGTVNSLIMPARQSMIAEIVTEARLMNAVALNTAGMNVMRIGAPTVGGLMLAGIGAGWVYLLMSGLYFAGAILLLPVKLIPQPASISAGGGRTRGRASGPKELVEGIGYMRRDRTILALLSVNFVIVLLSMPFQTMLPGFVDDVLNQGPDRLGLLMGIIGIGSLAGSLTIASLPPRRRGLMLLVSAAVMGAFLIAFSISTWFWVTAVIMIGIGIGQSGRMSLTNVILMSYTQPAYRGRVMSVNMMEFSLMAFGTFLLGIVANFLGIQLAIGLTAAGLVVFIAAVIMFVPRLRDLD